MEKFAWKAGFCTANKVTEEKYYLLGLAEDMHNFDHYLIFEKPYDNPEAEATGIYVDAQGNSSYGKIEYVTLSVNRFVVLVDGVLFEIDVRNTKISKKFKEYSRAIFGNLLMELDEPLEIDEEEDEDDE